MVVALDQRKEQTTLVPAHGTSVSVIIPYSKPDKVGNAIESVLAQDYPANLVEVILVGKGSSTLRECWPQIRAIDVGPIREPGRARNLGAAEGRGLSNRLPGVSAIGLDAGRRAFRGSKPPNRMRSQSISP